MKRKGFSKWFAAAGMLLAMLLALTISTFAGDGIDFYFDSQGYGKDIGVISTSFMPGDLLPNAFLMDYNPTAPGCRFRAWSLSPNSDMWAGDKVLTTLGCDLQIPWQRRHWRSHQRYSLRGRKIDHPAFRSRIHKTRLQLPELDNERGRNRHSL